MTFTNYAKIFILKKVKNIAMIRLELKNTHRRFQIAKIVESGYALVKTISSSFYFQKEYTGPIQERFHP
jgi:hypothetical protein